jgi:hypothetical protein
MKKILLTTHRLEMYAGAQLVCIDLAMYFIESGFNVYVGAFQLNSVFEKILEELEVKYVDLNNTYFDAPNEFDFIFACHNTTIDKLLKYFSVFSNKIVFLSLSPFESLEVPPEYYDKLSLLLVNSFETKDNLVSYGIDQNLIEIFPNPCSRVFFDYKPRNLLNKINPQKIAVISNHVPNEIKEIYSLFEMDGIVVDYYGVEYLQVLITPDILIKYDVVITIGRTVQQSLVLGIPVFCYDHFGGPGFIFMENIFNAGYYNFSGRCTKHKMSSLEIYNSIKSDYSNVVSQREKLINYARENFHLPTTIDKLLIRLEKCKNFVPASSELFKLQRKHYEIAHCLTFLQVYFDIGNEFSEYNSIVIDNLNNNVNTNIDLDKLDNLIDIRIDPLNDYCICKFNKIELMNSDLKFNLLPLLKTNGIEIEKNIIGFCTQDSQIFFDVEKSFFSNFSQLIILVDYQKTGVNALNSIYDYILKNTLYPEKLGLDKSTLHLCAITINESQKNDKLVNENTNLKNKIEQFNNELIRAEAQIELLKDILLSGKLENI